MKATNSRVHFLVFVAALVALYLILAFGIYAGVTSRVLGGNDFFSRWEGARALLLRGENPYSDEVTRAIQMGMYGRLARQDEDQVAFAYPLYVAFPIAPLVTLPYPLAQAFWMALLILAVVGGSVALIRLYHMSPRPIVLAMLVLGALVFYPSVRAIFNGQVTVLSFFFIAAALWAISVQADVAAGVLLAFATIKPQPAILLAPIIIVWAWRQGRRRIVSSAIGAMSVLTMAAMLLVPTWILDFLRALGHYAQYEPVGPPIQILGELIFSGDLSFVFTVAASLALLGWVVLQAARSLDASWDEFQLTLGLAAIVSTLMAGRMGTPDQLLLLIPWAQWLSARLRHGENAWAGIAGLVLLILPWYVFLATLRGNAENINVALVLPFLSLAVYLWHARNANRWALEQAR